MKRFSLNWIIIRLAVVVFIVLNGAVFYLSYTVLNQGSTDFVPTWEAGRAFLETGLNPYDEQVGLVSQEKIYGRPAEGKDDLFLFFYPFYTMLLFLPLATLPYSLAAAIYIHLLFLGLLLALGLSLHMYNWLPSPFMLATLLLWTILGYFSVRGLLLAQHALLAYTGHILALWGIFKKNDATALGGLLLATLKPQTGFLVIPLLLFWAWRSERQRLVGGFLGCFSAIMVLCFILQPSWFGDWLSQIRTYENSTETRATADILARVLPEAIYPMAYVGLMVSLTIPVIWAWKVLLVDQDQRYLLWTYCITMCLSLLIAPRTATTSYVHLYPVLYMTGWLTMQSKQQIWFYSLGLIVLVGYWFLHIQTIPPIEEYGAGREAPIVYAAFPLMIWVLLWVMRAKWLTLPTIMDRKGISS